MMKRETSAAAFRHQRGWVRYGAAVFAVAAAVLVRFLFDRYFGYAISPFIFFYPAVMFAVWYGRLGPGLFSTVLSLIVATYFFIPPYDELRVLQDPTTLIYMSLFLFVSLTICFLTDNLARAVNQQALTSRELRVSQNKVSNILESVQGCFFSVDDEERFIHINGDCKNLLPFPREELYGKSLWDAFAHWKDTEFEAELKHVMEHRVAVEFEFRDLAKAKWYDVHIGPSNEGVSVHLYDITVRKEVESALAESEGRFRLVADQAPVMVWMAGVDALCYYFNEPWLQFRGRALEEEQGYGWTEGIHPEDRQAFMDSYLQAFHARQSFRLEYRLKRADGQYRWVYDTGVPRFTADQRFVGFIGSAVDITGRKEAEQRQNLEHRITQILAGEETFQATIERALKVICEEFNWPVGVYWDLDSETNELRHRESWTRLDFQGRDFLNETRTIHFQPGIGLPGRVWALGKAFWIHDILQDPNFTRKVSAKKAGLHTGIGFPVRLKEETLGVMEFFGPEPEEPDLRLLQMFESLGIEVGQYIEAERTEEALRKSQEQFQLALQSAGMGYWILDFKDNRLTWSDNLAFLHGLSRETSAGTLESLLACIHPEDREMVQQKIENAIVNQSDYAAEFRTRWADGSVHWISGRGRVYLNDEGSPDRLVGFGLDMSERRRAEEELQAACEEMEKRVQQRTSQLAKINETLKEEILERKRVEKEVLEISEKEQRRLGSHIHDDLCQSLTGIMILTKVLTQKMERREVPEAHDLKKIAELLDQSITQAREMARGFYPVELQADSLMVVLKDLASRTETLHRISCRFECNEPILIEDNDVATHLYHIAQEAVRNAVRHGGAQRIEIRLARENQTMMNLTVQDDGKGLSDESGPGIGFHIMKYRARMMNAFLDVRRVKPNGTLISCAFSNPAPDSLSRFGKQKRDENAERA